MERIAELEEERDRLRGERDRMAAALRESDAQLEAVGGTAPAMLWITDTENRCTFLSRAWHEYTGQSDEEGLGFGWLDAVHPMDREETTQRFLHAVETQEPFSLDHRLRGRGGEYRWVLDVGRPRFDERGEWVGYAGSVIDIHDRHEALEALQRSEARYRTLFDSIDEGFCVLQMIFDQAGRPVDYRFLETNPAFVAQTGLTDAVGRTARELLPGLEEHWFEIYGEVALTGEPKRFESGSEVMGRWFDVFAFRIEEPEARKVALLFTDVSEHRKADEALIAAKQAAEAASEAKSRFLAVMSHELRTPLTAVIGFTDLLESEVLGATSAKQREALSRIRASSWHLIGIIDEILTLSRTEAGKEEIRAEEVDVAGVLREVMRVLDPQAVKRGITLRGVNTREPVQLTTDPGKLRQIVINLVGNAVKYTSHGTVTVEIAEDDAWLRVHVRDTGPGISAEDRERIFEAFTQVESSYTRGGSGAGLGLTISRKLARLLGGDIELRSREGEGSTFSVRLPRDAAWASTRASGQAAATGAEPGGPPASHV
jgi:PAS domain S-box-containing protein